ncbi:Oidioi.mRNA.OKI2018_I69.chr2.g4100.t1.cds [Oikopleura dioica]|uniref:Oidioi.mRNA.OKI2018_I69.chr2.g4100.t1.cds n=1 Tax=Oikopleura dioica TaxID=34765 RepID=A0ABN7SW93_OIKDI|nr:Oidioi.mRNA.OKI2018_I69.chr2.g4100.t1.cds [Oikopleura dioica]
MDTDLECVFDNYPAGLGVDHCRLFSYQLVRAINFIHTARIIHQDINPSNILVNPDTLFVKLGDFGSARILDVCFGKRCLSIPAYARYYHSPEVLAGTGIYDLSSDMFSLGCVLYIMATGTIPIKHESGAAPDLLKEWKSFNFTKKASPDAIFSNLIEKCLSTEPLNRPTASTPCSSSFFAELSNGAVHQVPKSKFSVEEEVFDYEHIYDG